MRGDFSRFSFDSARQFSRVLMQQGRVLLDADWNEQADVILHSVRRLAADLIGPHGGPAGAVGFAVSATTTDGEADLALGSGRYYVDGIACELTAATGGQPAATYLRQPYLPRRAGDPALPAAGPYVVYLDVWERHVTSLDDDDIREVALGGADTTSRAQIVWQVKILQPIAPFTEPQLVCPTFPIEEFRARLTGTRPRLRARTRPPLHDVNDDPCVASPDARYRGAENQLYRVEIHEVATEAGVPVVTFKWSRENGSVAAAWAETRRGNEVIVGGVRDRLRGFEAQQFVELTDDRRELRGEPGVIVPVTGVRGDTLTVNAEGVTIEANPRQLPNPIVRRWDHARTAADDLRNRAVKVRFPVPGDEAWINLEQGIQIQFQAPANPALPDTHRPGDYWLIPARVATGDVIWPREADGAPRALEPHGVEHHYAPLALIGPNRDFRRKVTPLAVCV